MRDVRVAFFGDSLVAGVGDPDGAGWVGRLVAAAFAAGTPVTAYNLGVRRETSSDVLARWTSELAPRLTTEADCRVVFSFGANDATWEGGGSRVAPDTSVANLVAMMGEARRRGLPVLAVGPAPVGDAPQRERIGRLSTAFVTAAAGHGVPYVHIAEALGASSRYRRELAAGDGAHPGSGGYALTAQLVLGPWLDWLSDAPPKVTARDG